jgi:hypothetical protein
MKSNQPTPPQSGRGMVVQVRYLTQGTYPLFRPRGAGYVPFAYNQNSKLTNGQQFSVSSVVKFLLLKRLSTLGYRRGFFICCRLILIYEIRKRAAGPRFVINLPRRRADGVWLFR